MRLAILCSGQAGQQRAMLDGLLDAPECAPVWQAASAVLGQDVAQWWCGLGAEEIFLNANAQFAIACYQLATWQRIAPLIPPPVVVAGYSLGELIAYHIAGALEVAETLRLVRIRAQLMDAALPPNAAGACMALWRGRVSPATLVRREQVQAECGLSVAIRRRENEEVLAGTPAAIARFVAELKALNPNLIPLPVSVPSHSHHLAAAAAAFRQVLSQSAITAPQLAVLSGVDASPVRSREQAINALSRQMDNTISWDGCMQTLAESGIDKAVELGPGNDLARLLEAEHPQIAARAVSDFRNYHALADWMSR